ncbi:hypothetical protein L2750_13905 [Shewanella submarina]|uniref:Uncharacterized protein n=1 Tax=Shewanella submarina TaxID=2016376 RepID=A0ABV7GK80_9GAMM|nr:hypothetical protein [Shewanella submarina]MCL1038238.1 hypothetical protein [Shewanella submarina]
MYSINEIVVLSGSWIYGGEVAEEVHIIKSNFRPGSGDYEDPLEIANDAFGVFFRLHFGKYPNEYRAQGGVYETIDEAMEYAKSVCPSLQWGVANEQNTQFIGSIS